MRLFFNKSEEVKLEKLQSLANRTLVVRPRLSGRLDLKMTSRSIDVREKVKVYQEIGVIYILK